MFVDRPALTMILQARFHAARPGDGRRDWLVIVEWPELDGLRATHGDDLVEEFRRSLEVRLERSLPVNQLAAWLTATRVGVWLSAVSHVEAAKAAQALLGLSHGARIILPDERERPVTARVAYSMLRDDDTMWQAMRWRAEHGLQQALVSGAHAPVLVSEPVEAMQRPESWRRDDGATRPMPPTTPFGPNVFAHWVPTGREGIAPLALPGSPHGVFELAWREFAYGDKRACLGRFTIDGAALTVSEVYRDMHVSNGGTTTWKAEAIAQGHGECGQLIVALDIGPVPVFTATGPDTWTCTVRRSAHAEVYNSAYYDSISTEAIVDLAARTVRLAQTAYFDSST